MEERYNIGNGAVNLKKGSITEQNSDAIVIPANPDLEFTGMGVQGAVARDGGRQIFTEAENLAEEYVQKHGKSNIGGQEGKVPKYSAHLTNAGNLPANYVIHSVALDYDSQQDILLCNKEIISESTENALNLAHQYKLKSLDFCALGTGLYGVPIENSLESIVDRFEHHLSKKSNNLENLGVVFLDSSSYSLATSYIESR